MKVIFLNTCMDVVDTKMEVLVRGRGGSRLGGEGSTWQQARR